jgi:hypothetical protein
VSCACGTTYNAQKTFSTIGLSLAPSSASAWLSRGTGRVRPPALPWPAWRRLALHAGGLRAAGCRLLCRAGAISQLHSEIKGILAEI